MTASRGEKFGAIMDRIKKEFGLEAPGFNELESGDTLYMPAPPQVEKMYHNNLDQTITQLIESKVLQGDPV